MIVLEKKFVLHVPLFKCENDELISTDVDISDLTDCLSKSGFDGAYVTKAKGIYECDGKLFVMNLIE